MGEGYNGWTNRETWAVALHVNNDQGWRESVHEIVREMESEHRAEMDEGDTLDREALVGDVAEGIERNVTALVDPLAYVEEFGDVSLSAWANGPGLAARDIGDLDNVNWHELAESFISDVKEDDEYESKTTTTTRTATLVRDNLPNATGHQALYRLTPALTGHEYVVVSATTVPHGGPETYIFAADAEGAIVNWSELEGSYKGGLSHAVALRNAGYTITD